MSPFDSMPRRASPSLPARPLTTSRYTDSNGVQWTVREIIPEMRVTERRTLLTRPGYENGWLSFRSEGMACRIAPFPASWRSISEYELERWCMKAKAAALVRKTGR